MSSSSDSEGNNDTIPVRKLLDGVAARLSNGNWKQAKVELSEILMLKRISRREILRTLLLRGTVHMKLKKPRLAVQDWQTVLVLDPKNKSARAHLDGEEDGDTFNQEPPNSDSDSDESSSDESNWKVKRVNIKDVRVSFSGEILVTRCDTGEILGYIIDEQSEGKHYSLTKDHNDALSISVDGITPFEIRVTGTSTHGFLGWSTGSNPVLKGQSYGSAILMRTPHTEPNARPLAAPNDPRWVSESSVWYLDNRNRRLTAEWINPDGSSVPNDICVAPTAPGSPIYLTANAKELASRLREDSEEDTPELIAVYLTVA